MRNLGAVDFSLYHLPEDDFIRLNGDNRWEAKNNYLPRPENLIRNWQVETTPELNSSVLYGTNLSGEKNGVLEPGLYYLVASVKRDYIYPEAIPPVSTLSERQIIVVSNHNLTFKTSGTESMAWLTDVQTGQPVADATVRFLTERDKLGQGATDSLGVARADHEQVETWLPRYAISDEPFALALNYWSEGVERWQFWHLYRRFCAALHGSLPHGPAHLSPRSDRLLQSRLPGR